MRVTVLGTANAWGVNELTLDPAMPRRLVEALADNTEVEIRRFRTSLFIETCDNERILVDCGPDFGHQRREFGLGLVSHILITHPHFDHIRGLDELNVYRPTGQLPIKTYATTECWRCITEDRGFDYLERIGLVAYQPLKPSAKEPPERELRIGDHLTVTPFSVEHSAIASGAVGFVFEETTRNGAKTMLYTGDLWAVSNPADSLFQKRFNVLIIECDRCDGFVGPSVGGGHMSLVEAVRWLKDGVFSNPRPDQVVFVHLGDTGPNGPTSSYDAWRERILGDLEAAGLRGLVRDRDRVVGYEGLTPEL